MGRVIYEGIGATSIVGEVQRVTGEEVPRLANESIVCSPRSQNSLAELAPLQAFGRSSLNILRKL